MESFPVSLAFLLVVGLLLCLQPAAGIRFVIDREECFSHDVPYEGDAIHFSFVVIKSENPWHYGNENVDLVVRDPAGDQIHDFRGRVSERFEFTARRKGLHRFCFTNNAPYHSTLDFDVHIAHFSYLEQHAKDEHISPLLEQIGKLEEALYNIQFEQHWLEAQTERQAIVNEGMSRRAIHKALFESAALIGASVLQVYLLQRLFERKLGTSRVHAMDFVVLCMGRFSDIPNIPTNFPNNNGPEVFHGKVIHSMDLAKLGGVAAEELVKNKRIIIVGFLKSALDIAAVCSNINGEEYPCTMIIRTKRWVIPNLNVWGMPLSFFYFNRFAELLTHKPNEGFLLFLLAFFLSPLRWLISKIVEAYYKRVVPMKKYDIVPEHSFSYAVASCLLAISPENFYENVEKGSIVLKQSKSFEFYEDGIIVKDKSLTQIKADLVIFATGYKGDHKLINIFASPMFQDLMAGSLDFSFPLYRECIHPRIPQMTVIGYTESFSNLHTSEMRAIWIAQLLDGGFRLPSIKLMEKDVVEWKKYMKRNSFKRSSISIIHTWYNDFLCKDIGCNPRRKKGFLANIFMPYGPLDYVGVGSIDKQ